MYSAALLPTTVATPVRRELRGIITALVAGRRIRVAIKRDDSMNPSRPFILRPVATFDFTTMQHPANIKTPFNEPKGEYVNNFLFLPRNAARER